MTMLSVVAILGNILIIFSVLPQIYTQVKTKTRKGLSALMIWCWVIGNGFMLIYNIIEVRDFYNNILFTLNILTSVFMLYLYYFRSK
ncbi:PQ-loop repeat-containing protein [Candidatus Woesearchaeota archaeon]|nr:PQ-loop repeat-containing protein [Candidatus Woesearchaeota archaeon]